MEGGGARPPTNTVPSTPLLVTGKVLFEAMLGLRDTAPPAAGNLTVEEAPAPAPPRACAWLSSITHESTTAGVQRRGKGCKGAQEAEKNAP